MQVHTIPVTPFEQNARIIVDETTKVGAVVDPGGGVELILDGIHEHAVKVDQILLTHAHLDHAGGVRRLLAALEERQGFRPQLLAHRAEAPMRARVADQALMYGLSAKEYENCPEPDRYLEEGDLIKVGSAVAEVRFTPGHSPGHIVFYFGADQLLIAGDTLFQGSVGRTDLPGGDHGQLMRSIQSRIYTLPDDTVVMCGHGPDTAVGIEKRSNPFVRGEHVDQ